MNEVIQGILSIDIDIDIGCPVTYRDKNGTLAQAIIEGQLQCSLGTYFVLHRLVDSEKDRVEKSQCTKIRVSDIRKPLTHFEARKRISASQSRKQNVSSLKRRKFGRVVRVHNRHGFITVVLQYDDGKESDYLLADDLELRCITARTHSQVSRT